MGKIEFEMLFQEKKIYFTNPVEWKKSLTGDKTKIIWKIGIRIEITY